MAESNRPSDDDSRAGAILRSVQDQGLVNLDYPLRVAIDYMAQAPGTEGKLLVAVLQKLHDQGVVNLEASMKKAIDAVNMRELSKLEATLFANDNYCIIPRASK